MIAEHGVTALFTAPTAFRAIKKEDPDGDAASREYDLSKLRTLFLAGERLDPATLDWAARAARRAGDRPLVADRDRLAASPANLRGLEPMPIKPGSPTVPMPGYDVRRPRRPTEPVRRRARRARSCIKLPLPPGCLPTLWERRRALHASPTCRAFPGYYKTADGGYIDEDGYVFVMGRTDDIINVAGHRLSTGGMEEVLASHPDVAECAVIGVNDALKGQVPCGFVVLKAGVDARPRTRSTTELVALVRDQLGAGRRVQGRRRGAGLPKTRSGKILRKTMRRSPTARTRPVPSTIEDASVLDTLRPVLQKGPGA